MCFYPEQRGEAVVAQWTRQSAVLSSRRQGISGELFDPEQRIQGETLVFLFTLRYTEMRLIHEKYKTQLGCKILGKN